MPLRGRLAALFALIAVACGGAASGGGADAGEGEAEAEAEAEAEGEAEAEAEAEAEGEGERDGGPGPGAARVGDPCEVADDPDYHQGTCADGQVCLGRHWGFSGGMCSQPCPTGRCPEGSGCVNVGFDEVFCYPLCEHDADCRWNYSCRRFEGGAVCDRVFLPVGTRDNGGGPCDDGEPDPRAAPRAFSANVAISRGRSEIEVEPAIAAAPDGTLVVAFMVAQAGWHVGAARSTDGGRTWQRLANFDDPINLEEWDPIVVATPADEFLIGWAGADGAPGFPYLAEIRVARSGDGGRSFGAPVTVAACEDCGLDKPHAAVDAEGTVFVAYAHVDYDDYGYMDWRRIRVARSDDGGASFARPVEVRRSRELLQTFPAIATGEPGSVYVAWSAFVRYWGAPENEIRLARSHDGGATFDDRIAHDDGETPSWGQLALAADGRRVLLVYPTGDADGRFDLRTVRSEDGGATLVGRGLLHPDTGCATHVMPAAALDEAGGVHLAWADNRFGWAAVHHVHLPDPWGAAAPGAPRFVNDAPLPVGIDRASDLWFGDYLGLAVTSAAVHAVWADGRDVSSHVWHASAPR